MRRLVLALLLLVTAACGSTVHLPAQTQAPGGTADGLSAPTGAASAPPADAGTPDGSAQPGGGRSSGPAVGEPGTALTSGDNSGSSSGIGGHGVALTGPGVTATTITIGLVYATNGNAANEAFGASGIATGDDRKEVGLVVDDINRHGGVAGRKLVVLPYGEDATSSQPYAVTAQQMCTFMTQDHKVLAVVLAFSLGDPKACLNRAGTAELSGSTLGVMDSESTSGLDFASAAMNLDRSVLAAVKAWTVGNWYAPWDTLRAAPKPGGTFKMGVLSFDDPRFDHAVNKVLIPALVRAGRTPPATQDIVRLSNAASAGDDGSVLAAIQSAVLKFRQDGVDHVLVMDSAGSATLFFANDAYSQGYFPRLGGGSGNAFQTLMETGNVQKKSVTGAVGAGWLPVLDLPYDGSDRKYEDRGAAAHCRALMAAGNQSLDNANAAVFALGYCDSLTLLARALDRAPSLTAVGFAQGAEALGRSLPSAVTAGLDVAPGHHDAAGAFYANVYDDACGCFTYRGPRQLI